MLSNVAFFVACTDGTSADHGFDANLNVSGGTFFRGDLPISGKGPSVISLYLTRLAFAAGYVGKSFSGVLEENSVAAAIALEGDVGYFSVDAKPPGAENPTAPIFETALSFSRDVAMGEHRLLVWAIDAQGQLGSMATTSFTLLESEVPDSDLAIRLTWDTNADLDLSVEIPNGIVISSANPSSAVTAPGQAPEINQTGLLDRDSNKDCDIDGIRQENVAFVHGCASGHYRVYVSVPSLCGETAVHYRVEAFARSKLLGTATSNLTATTRRASAMQNGKTLALDVVVP
jgi:hypothetical protein